LDDEEVNDSMETLHKTFPLNKILFLPNDMEIKVVKMEEKST